MVTATGDTALIDYYYTTAAQPQQEVNIYVFDTPAAYAWNYNPWDAWNHPLLLMELRLGLSRRILERELLAMVLHRLELQSLVRSELELGMELGMELGLELSRMEPGLVSRLASPRPLSRPPSRPPSRLSPTRPGGHWASTRPAPRVRTVLPTAHQHGPSPHRRQPLGL